MLHKRQRHHRIPTARNDRPPERRFLPAAAEVTNEPTANADNRLRAKLSTRRGALLLIALICLMLVSMLGATIVSLTSSQRKQQQSTQFRLQAESLADSAVERAAAQLARDPAYAGETWEPEMGTIQGESRGVARIVVIADESVPGRRHVTAVADFPHRSHRRARSRRDMTIDL